MRDGRTEMVTMRLATSLEYQFVRNDVATPCVAELEVFVLG